MHQSKKILLVSSSIEEVLLSTLDKFDKIGMKTDDDSDGYPLGLAYLHSYLEKFGHELKTLFLNNYGYNYCFEQVELAISTFTPDIVGFQVLTQNRISTYRLVEYLQKKAPNTKIVLGGVHATILYKQLLEKFPHAIIVLGEGEKTFSELVEKIDNPEKYNEIDGIAFVKKGETILNNPRKLIENLDELPFPKHELFFNGNRKCGIILTARGCPFSCSFCSLDLITRRRVRYRSIENVMEEIEWMISKFPKMTSIWLQDDTFFVDNSRVIRFCEEVIKRNIQLKFICSARFKPISQEMVDALVRANFTKIYFGLESGDDEILKKCHKGINQKDIISAVNLFKNNKIAIYAHLIVGLPGETKETIITTAKLVQKIQRIKYIDYHTAYLLTVYPGTEVYDISKSMGTLTDEYWADDNITPIFTAEHSLEELYEYKDLLLYYVSGVRAFTTIKGFIHQYYMIPYHLKFFLSSRSKSKAFIYNLAKILLSEKYFSYIKKIVKALKNMSNFSNFIKKVLIKTKLNSFFSDKKISYSQSGEDLIIDFILGVLKIKTPNYLEIGSYDYKKINNTYLFYKKGARGICVEPDPVLFKKFKKMRPGDKCLNIGVSGNEKGLKKFYLMDSKTLNTFSLEEAKKNEQNGFKIAEEIEIEIEPINNIIKEHFPTPPNIFSLDTEGLDYEIISNIDFANFRPDIFCIETICLDIDSESKEKNIIELLKSNNYLVYADTHINTIFVDKNKWLKAINKKTAENI